MDADTATLEDTRQVLYDGIRECFDEIAAQFLADEGKAALSMRASVDVAQAELGGYLRDRLADGSSLPPGEVLPILETHFAELTNNAKERVMAKHEVMENFWRHLETEGAEKIGVFMTSRMKELEQSHGKALKTNENMLSNARNKTEQLERDTRNAEQALQVLTKESDERMSTLKQDGEKLQRRLLSVTSANKSITDQVSFMQRENEELKRKIFAFETRNKKEKNRFTAMSDSDEEEDYVGANRRRQISNLSILTAGNSDVPTSALDRVIGRESDVDVAEDVPDSPRRGVALPQIGSNSGGRAGGARQSMGGTVGGQKLVVSSMVGQRLQAMQMQMRARKRAQRKRDKSLRDTAAEDARACDVMRCR